MAARQGVTMNIQSLNQSQDQLVSHSIMAQPNGLDPRATIQAPNGNKLVPIGCLVEFIGQTLRRQPPLPY